MTRQSRFLLPAALYSLPLFGVFLVWGSIDLFVPRDRASTILGSMKDAKPALGADALAAFYYMGLGYFLVAIACLTSLAWCLWTIHKRYPELNSDERPYFIFGLVLSFVVPLGALAAHYPYPGCGFVAIDDCSTWTLLESTVHKVYNSVYSVKFAFRYDADVFACLVFVTYLVSLSTVTLIVGTKPDQPTPTSGVMTDEERRQALNMILLLTAIVLIASTLSSRLRFDVGLATLGAPPTKEVPNVPFAAYQTIASAIMAFWASVLSVFIALVYVPGAMLLNFRTSPSGSIDFNSWLKLDGTNFEKLVKVAAIASPALVNKLLDIFSIATKGA